MTEFIGTAEPLSGQGLRDVMDDLGLQAPELLAMLAVESRSCGFLPDRRPKILFERHWFHRLTGGRFSAQYPDISNAEAGGYAGDALEFLRLKKAIALDRKAALESASWGAGQVMGFNHDAAGFSDVEAMIEAMQQSEDAQLLSIGSFLKANRLVPLLKSHDWVSFARAYNGPAFTENKYDARLAGAFQQYSAGVLPDVDVRRAQLYLTYLGFTPGGVDGIHGKLSRSAVVMFRAANNLGTSDRVDGTLLDAMRSLVRRL